MLAAFPHEWSSPVCHFGMWLNALKANDLRLNSIYLLLRKCRHYGMIDCRTVCILDTCWTCKQCHSKHVHIWTSAITAKLKCRAATMWVLMKERQRVWGKWKKYLAYVQNDESLCRSLYIHSGPLRCARGPLTWPPLSLDVRDQCKLCSYTFTVCQIMQQYSYVCL